MNANSALSIDTSGFAEYGFHIIGHWSVEQKYTQNRQCFLKTMNAFYANKNITDLCSN